jgi:hypothetical protein
VLGILGGGAPMTAATLAVALSARSASSVEASRIVQVLRDLARRGAIGMRRGVVDGRSEWLCWAPGDPTVLARHAPPPFLSTWGRDLVSRRDQDRAFGEEGVELWTLHDDPVARGGIPLAIRRHATPTRDGFLAFALGKRGTQASGLVDVEELAARGRARTCSPSNGAWHSVVWVFDHRPTRDERVAWRAARKVERTALRAPARTLWLILPEEHGTPDRVVACGVREVRPGHTTRRYRRGDLELRAPFAGFRGDIVDGLELAARGFASVRIGTSAFVVCASPPQQGVLDPPTRTHAEAARARADAAAFLASPTATIRSGADALALLGLPRSASASDVARAFRRRVVSEQAHPDQGGTAEAFAELVRLRDLAIGVLGPRTRTP